MDWESMPMAKTAASSPLFTTMYLGCSPDLLNARSWEVSGVRPVAGPKNSASEASGEPPVTL